MNEFNYLIEVLRQRLHTAKLLYPLNFGLGERSSFLIYCLIREIKPKIIIETGVANGISTFFILNAIIRNGNGKLYSIDISKDVGAILSEEEKKIWNLIVINPKRRCLTKAIENILNKSNNRKIDMFIHDSNHTYRWQIFEYELIYPLLDEDGILVSDDIDFSYAFLDFIKKHSCKALGLFDRYKISGILRKNCKY